MPLKIFNYSNCFSENEITGDDRCNTDIRSRVGQVEKAFAKLLQLFFKNIDLEVGNKLFKTYVWSVALYSCEA